MDDITTRLRRWTHAVDAVPASDLMDEAAAEIERLRLAIRRLADQDATLSVQGGNVTVTMDATLTDAEREAVECGIHAIGIAPRDDRTLAFADVLQRLLERTK